MDWYEGAPLQSLDPTDWFMYCDMMQDRGAEEEVWRDALLVAESLQSHGPELILVYEHSQVFGRFFRRKVVRMAWLTDRPETLSLTWARTEWAGKLSAPMPDFAPAHYGTPWSAPETFVGRWLAAQSEATRESLLFKFWLTHSMREWPLEE